MEKKKPRSVCADCERFGVGSPVCDDCKYVEIGSPDGDCAYGGLCCFGVCGEEENPE